MHYLKYVIYRSPEVNKLKAGKPIVISSEFPSWQNDSGESKGGMLLFKFAKQKKAKTTPNKLKVNMTIHCVYYKDSYCTFYQGKLFDIVLFMIIPVFFVHF